MAYTRKRKHSIFIDTTNTEPELLPHFPEALLRYTLFSYLEDDTYTKSQLAMHPQFKNIAQYSALWQAVVEGDQELAESIIKKHPEWLFESSTVKDLSGRTIENVTPFELAYGADDVDMLTMMLPYLDKLENGRERALNQIKENFSEYKEKQSYDFSSIVDAITENDDENMKEVKSVKEAFHKMREYFKSAVIKKGQKHFNMQIFIEACHIFNENYYRWSVWQYVIFFRQVIGYVERMFPACYAQAFCQGIYSVTECGQALKRSLKTKEDTFFYPSDLDSHSGLGFDFAISMDGYIQGNNTWGMWQLCSAPNLSFFEPYVEQKRLNLSNLLMRCERDGPPPRPPFF